MFWCDCVSFFSICTLLYFCNSEYECNCILCGCPCPTFCICAYLLGGITVYVCISRGYKWTRLADTSRHDKALLPEKLTPLLALHSISYPWTVFSTCSQYFIPLSVFIFNYQISIICFSPFHSFDIEMQSWFSEMNIGHFSDLRLVPHYRNSQQNSYKNHMRHIHLLFVDMLMNTAQVLL